MMPYFIIGSPKLCVYCGDDAKETDHVIPISQQTVEQDPSGRKTQYGPVANCCKSCNQILGNKYFDSFEERCRFVANYLNDRTKAVIWTEGEMRQLDVSLRRYVQQQQARRLWMRFRSDWFQSRDYLLNLEQIAWEDCLDKESPKFNEPLFKYFELTLIWLKAI